MSVVGFDFGHQTSVIAVARGGGIDTIANEVSNRLTPSMVSFGAKERFIGESALNQLIMNFKNTLGSLQTFLGRKFQEKEIQEELKRYPIPSKELPNGEVGFQVQYNGEQTTFSVVQLVSMILYKLKTTTEKELGGRMSDAAISCPGYFTDAQRRALLAASEIAGINCVRLVNETTATALYWGFYRRDLPENDPIHVMFIDCGYKNTSVSIVDFTKTKIKVLSSAYDNNLGGRNLDDALVAHFNEEFKTKYGIDVNTIPRAKIRLTQACERLKKVLSSGVTESVLNVESLANDRDVSSKMTRSDFEAMIQPLLERMVGLAKRALENAGLTPEQLTTVEIVGGNKRVPAVQKVFSDFLKKELGQTLNDSEAVAKGCALQCAMLSPTLRVRQITITDLHPYPIKISWSGVDEMHVEGQESSAEIFPVNSPFPATKYVTLTRNSPFEIVANYADSALLPAEQSRLIGRWVIPTVPATSPDSKENPKVKVKVRLSNDDIFVVEGAEYQETVEVEEPAPATTATPAANGTPATPSTPTPAPEASAEAPASPAPPATPEAAPSPVGEPAKKKKIRNTALKIDSHIPALSKKDVQSFLEEEGRMQSQDRLVVETVNAKNAVESYILGMRNRLSGDLNEYATQEEKDKLESVLAAAEDWLYDEGDDATKGVYIAKKAELQKLGDPISDRKTEHEKRTANYSAFKKTVEHYRAAIHDPKYEHIEAAEKDKILQAALESENHIDDLWAKQSSLAKVATPVLRSDEINSKKDALERLSNQILSKPKPAPPAPAPTPAPEAAADANKPADQANPQSTEDTPMADADSSKPKVEEIPTENKEDTPMTEA